MPGFDWNGNGKRDALDSFMDMKIMSDASSDSDNGFSDYDDDVINDFPNDSSGSIGSTFMCDENDDYSWRENYDYDFEHNIAPEDYETEEEYLEALEEAKIDSTSVLNQPQTIINSPYKVGETILHNSFGVGVVAAVKSVGNEFILDINFQSLGRKQIFTGLAKLSTNPDEIKKAKCVNKVIDNSQVYDFCKVLIEGTNEPYYYLFNNMQVNINDYVEVPFGKSNSISNGIVVAVGNCLEKALPCRLENMKYVFKVINSAPCNIAHSSTKPSNQDANVFFEDENIRVTFVKWERNCYLVGGYAKAGTFIFENKSIKRLCIYMKEISVGGFLNRDETFQTVLSEKQKEMETFPFVYENKIPNHLNDCKTVEFKICYGALRDGCSTKANMIEPFESNIISIPL